MSTSAPPSDSFDALWDAALKDYTDKTGTNLLVHEHADLFDDCHSPDAVVGAIEEELANFAKFRAEDSKWGKLRARVKPFIDLVVKLNDGAGDFVGSTLPGGKLIFVAASAMLSATKGVSDNYDALVELFEKFGDYLERLSGRLCTGSTMGPSSKKIVVEVLAEMIKTLGLAMKLLKGGRFKHWVKTLFGDNDMKNALLRLDKLAARENDMILSEIYADIKDIRNGHADVQVIHDLENKVDKVYNLHVDAQIKQWLQAPDPSTNHHLARKLRHANSGKWFTDGQSFQEWSLSGSSTYWVHGKPGAGKSVLCSTVIEEVKASGACVVYFYHAFSDVDKQTARGLLASLVLQLSGSSKERLAVLRECYQKHGSLGSGMPSTDVLWSCFQELAMIGLLPVTVVIDALDECPYKERVEVLNFLEKMSEHAHLRLFVTSRLEADVQRCLRRLRSHECNLHELDAQASDMRSYITHVMSTDFPFSGWPRNLVDLTADTLSSKANGMFRWVFCQLEVLKDCLPKHVRDALKSLPDTLDETYERILRGMSPLHAADASRIFQYIAFAGTRSTARQLAEILAIDFTSDPPLPQFDSQYRVSDPTAELLRLCSGLIVILPIPKLYAPDDSHSEYSDESGEHLGTVQFAHALDDSYSDESDIPELYAPDDSYSEYSDESGEHFGIVQFAHFSVKEYLLSNRLPADLHLFHIDEKLARAEIVRICLACILSKEYSDSILAHHDIKKLRRALPLAADSTLHWRKHVRYSGVAELVEPQLNEFFVLSKASFEAWMCISERDFHTPGLLMTSFAVRSPYTCQIYRPIELAASLGLDRQIQQLVSADKEVLAHEDQGLIGLLLACEYNHLGTIKLLRDLGVDIHGPVPKTEDTKEGGNVLTYACCCGSDLGIIEYLLECGFNLEEQDDAGRTALLCTIEFGFLHPELSFDVVRLLLAHHADIEARDHLGRTPLHAASCLDDSRIANLLLERGASVCAKDSEGSTGTNLIDMVDLDGETPLHFATKHRQLEVVSALIAYGARRDIQSKRGKSPMALAQENGQVIMVELLSTRRLISMQEHIELEKAWFSTHRDVTWIVPPTHPLSSSQ